VNIRIPEGSCAGCCRYNEIVQALTAYLALLLQAADPYAAGMKALEEQKYDLASQEFSKAVEAAPGDYAARFHLALADSLLGKDEEAIAGYRKVLELKPGLYEAELNLGMVLVRQKQFPEAIPHLKTAASLKPAEQRPAAYLADAELGLGRALATAGKFEEAAPLFRGEQQLELASLYEKAGRTADAIATYGKFPENAAARERMGNLLVVAGKPAEAIPHLEFAVQNSPTAANRYALATAQLRSGQPEKALALLEAALQSEPANAALRMTNGRVLRDLRRFPAAAQEFLKAVRTEPDNKEAWSELAGMLLLTENYPQALAAFDKLRALGEDGPAQYYFRAIALDRMKQYPDALASYQKFLSLSENKFPDEEFKARQRIRVIQKELSKR